MESPRIFASKNDLVDRLAIFLSGLCLIHCIGTVLILSLVASLSGFLLNPLIHEIGLVLAIGLGLFAFARGIIVHRQMIPSIVGGTGLFAMGFALTLRHGVSGEVILTIIGVLLVAVAHEMNRRAALPR